ncbi:Tim44 domain-containing protein [Megalodesulfovibrio gigas]|uniref:Putative import inner membrane translocase subunit Tim44 n=1 Tax=Megalodesulfovibrio gigas (strain ATCC 19364 / DSM 1382 / NCIMB 9332 / VKM B-1759) TaxID=1121448 RepID=T2GD32_MEGG1|nr:TIM44-like domain-containing protein [Megalodesulfovibrio gigas]AGW14036.1 putative import inner membrane translocase subunit Tim44 [Megalodesulfovibrio gigas DSM 1382 = ATCC 19364]
MLRSVFVPLSRSAATLARIPLMALCLMLTTAEFSDAKRMGGGKSFGSKPSYSNSQPAAPQSPSAQRQAAGTQGQQQNQPGQAAQPAAKPGLLSGGLGGMLGGLLMGGLLGSMLFGGGLGGGFGGILELLLLGLVAFMAFRFFRNRRAAQANNMEPAMATAGTSARSTAHEPAGQQSHHQNSGWGNLREQEEQPQTPAGPTMPPGLDEASFLEGARLLYGRLQASWDKRDLADIRSFTSDEVYAEIARQAQDDPTPGTTEILYLDAKVLEVRRNGAETVIAVLYDAMLREEREADRPSQVREVWHFSRDESQTNPEWTLEGIQQMQG